ncbi:MAG: CinA family protein [Bacteroidetes bacterium]|nr:CinA family protein [Bacteroidota bacterium]
MAFAESVTCGMIASKLNTIKGTGYFFAGSIVSMIPMSKLAC